MFRKFKKAVEQAAAAITGSDEKNVNTLMEMGFDSTQARTALNSTDGNVERAAELLLASGGIISSNENDGSSNNYHEQQRHQQQYPSQDDTDLQRALQESLQEEKHRNTPSTRTAATTRSAASVRAGLAALLRSEAEAKKDSYTKKKSKSNLNKSKSRNVSSKKPAPVPPPPTSQNSYVPKHSVNSVLAKHHPDVKIPKKLIEKSKEEQIVRCADRLKSSPRAVDTLYLSLTALNKEPNNDKFRKIDKTTAGYQRSLANAPGAEDMLKAMNFIPRGPNNLELLLPQYDPMLLYLGISSLEETRKKKEYINAKRKIKFSVEIQEIRFSSDDSVEEAIKRAEFIKKCPSEPNDGRGALIQVVITDEWQIKRRFDGDDTLSDVLNWIGGNGSVIPNKIVESHEWIIVDLNRYPLIPIDCNFHLNHTLQYIGCWPSGRLEIMPALEEDKNKRGNDNKTQIGATSGLASGIDL